MVLLNLLVIPLSWWTTKQVFREMTDSGEIYSRVAKTPTEDFERYETIEKLSYFAVWRSVSRSLTLRIDGPDRYLMQLGARVSESEITLSWENAYSGWDRIQKYVGVKNRYGKETVIAFSEESKLLPFARDVTIKIPPGAIGPWVSLVLEGSLKGADLGNLEKDERKTLVNRLTAEILGATGIKQLGDNLTFVSLACGKVQFATLWLFFYAIVVMIVAVWWSRAEVLGATAADMIPYFGFFGTLLGMGGALGILGDADLSDSVSKAVNLGPIGSQLSLAIDTTKFALVLYVMASLFGALLAARREREEIPSDS